MLEFWEAGPESKGRHSFHLGVFQRKVSTDFSILLLIFQAIKDGVLQNIGITNSKENHLAHSNFLAGAGASLQVTEKSFWAQINIIPVSGNVPPNKLPALLASSLQWRQLL